MWIDLVAEELVLPGSSMAIFPAPLFLHNGGGEGGPWGPFYDGTKHTEEYFFFKKKNITSLQCLRFHPMNVEMQGPSLNVQMVTLLHSYRHEILERCWVKWGLVTPLS